MKELAARNPAMLAVGFFSSEKQRAAATGFCATLVLAVPFAVYEF